MFEASYFSRLPIIVLSVDQVLAADQQTGLSSGCRVRLLGSGASHFSIAVLGTAPR